MAVENRDRPIDVLREEVIDQLIVNYSHEELSLEAFERRLDQALASDDASELGDLVVDLELKADFTRAAQTDALEEALDYAAISQRIIAVCDESRFQLLEALADHLAAIVLAEFSVERLWMTITKPGAVPEAEGVGVVIDRP